MLAMIVVKMECDLLFESLIAEKIRHMVEEDPTSVTSYPECPEVWKLISCVFCFGCIFSLFLYSPKNYGGGSTCFLDALY